MSVGAMLALEIVTKYSHLLAGAVPAAAGVLYGYWKPPADPIPFMDIHGLYDDTIPANVTNSHLYQMHGARFVTDTIVQLSLLLGFPDWHWLDASRRVAGQQHASRVSTFLPFVGINHFSTLKARQQRGTRWVRLFIRWLLLRPVV
jgi:hypothetical protein